MEDHRRLLREAVRSADRTIEDQKENDGAEKEGVLGPEGGLIRNQELSLSKEPSLSRMFADVQEMNAAAPGPKKATSWGEVTHSGPFVPSPECRCTAGRPVAKAHSAQRAARCLHLLLPSRGVPIEQAPRRAPRAMLVLEYGEIQ